MDFLKKRVRQYQEKKLNEASLKIKFHSDMKKQLEKQAKSAENGEDKTSILREISLHYEMVIIWQKNYEKIKKELKKIDS